MATVLAEETVGTGGRSYRYADCGDGERIERAACTVIDAVQGVGQHVTDVTNGNFSETRAGIRHVVDTSNGNFAETRSSIRHAIDSSDGGFKEVRGQVRHAVDMSEGNFRETRAGIDQTISEVRSEGRWGKEATVREGERGRDVTSDWGRYNNGSTSDWGRRVTKDICDLNKDLLRGDCDIKELTRDGFAQAFRDQSVIATNVQSLLISGFKDARYDASNFAAQALVDSTKNAAAVALQNAVNQSATMLAFKDQALLSRELACDAAKQLAECCCELKALTLSENGKTRDLLCEQSRLESVRRELKLEVELQSLKSSLSDPCGRRGRD